MAYKGLCVAPQPWVTVVLRGIGPESGHILPFYRAVLACRQGLWGLSFITAYNGAIKTWLYIEKT